jgi:DNA-binding PucR family transcriptional regulator
MNVNYDPFKYPFDRLEDIADRISEVLQCPITIEDVNHRLLAYSMHDDCTDPARISTIISRRVPEKVINSLWKDGTIPTLLKTEEPVRVKQHDDIGLGNRVAISIWKNKEVLGFIWALEIHKTLSDEDLDLLKKAAKAVRNILLKLQVRKTKKEERSQEFFWKLLTGHVTSQEEIIDSFHELSLTPPSQYSIIILKFDEEVTETMEKQLTYLLQTTQQVQVLLYTLDFNELIIMVSPKHDTEQPMKDLKHFLNNFCIQLKDRYNIHHIKPSIGGLYFNILQVEKSYKEAQSVLSMKEKFPEETRDIYTYAELGIYQYLDLLIEKRQQDGLTNYSLKKLKEYDLAHHTNLVETLETYIEKDSNINEAAKALNIHINTLNYRLKRIAQIAEIDLKNPNEKITIYLDMKIEKYTS